MTGEPAATVLATGSSEYTVAESTRTEITGRSTTTPANVTVPAAGALTNSPGTAGRSTPRCPEVYGVSGARNAPDTVNVPARGGSQRGAAQASALGTGRGSALAPGDTVSKNAQSTPCTRIDRARNRAVRAPGAASPCDSAPRTPGEETKGICMPRVCDPALPVHGGTPCLWKHCRDRRGSRKCERGRSAGVAQTTRESAPPRAVSRGPGCYTGRRTSKEVTSRAHSSAHRHRSSDLLIEAAGPEGTRI